MIQVRVLMKRGRDWLSASDPGLLRLRSTGKTAATIIVSLVVLYALSQAFGQPITGALLGVMMSMQASSITSEPDPRQRIITLLLVLLSSSAAVTLGILLASNQVVSTIGLVVILFIVAYLKRFGSRGSTSGMAAYMAYFLLVVLGSLGSSGVQTSQLLWFIIAVIVGTLCGFVMNVFVLRDRPERILRSMLPVLSIRVGAIIDALCELLQAGKLDKRFRRRLHRRVSQLNETGLMVEQQLEQVDTKVLPPGITKDTLMRCLFDIELATENLVAPALTAVSDDLSSASRAALVKMLTTLRMALHGDIPMVALQNTDTSSIGLALKGLSDGSRAQQLVQATAWLATALIRTQAVAAGHADDGQTMDTSAAEPGEAQAVKADDNHIDDNVSDDDQNQPKSLFDRMLPTTRQAIQVAIATGLATIAGLLLSSHRWYWAVIAAFIVFTGTTSRGEALTKGWQRLFGTLCGVVLGVLIAAVVGGNTVVSIILIILCLFSMFYWMKANYGIMVVSTTTMLALLYGLLGQFSIGLLLTRLEETAIGVVIGILIALFVLPTHTSEIVRDGIRKFLAGLNELVVHASARLVGESMTGDLIAQARDLNQHLQQLRNSAKPLTQGIVGGSVRSSVQHTILILMACAYYMRRLARVVNQIDTTTLDAPLRATLKPTTCQINANIEALSAILAHHQPAAIHSAGKLLDAVEDAVLSDHYQADDQYLLGAMRNLRLIDQAIVRLASDLGAPTVEAEIDRVPVGIALKIGLPLHKDVLDE